MLKIFEFHQGKKHGYHQWMIKAIAACPEPVWNQPRQKLSSIQSETGKKTAKASI